MPAWHFSSTRDSAPCQIPKNLLHSCANFGLVPVPSLEDFVHHTITTGALVGEVFGVRCGTLNQLLLTGIGQVTRDTLFIATKQIRQRMFVMHVGRRDHCAVGQPTLAVRADVQLHAKVPLLALAGLMHIGITRFVGVLGRARSLAPDGFK
jgi:hypothetical protein